MFGFFFSGILALVIWSIVTSDTCRKTNPCALTLGLPQRDLADELRHGGAQLVSDDLLELRGRGQWLLSLQPERGARGTGANPNASLKA
jgi:hypothetical protein